MTKGFKDEEGKFRPTEKNVSGISSKQLKSGTESVASIDNKKLLDEKSIKDNLLLDFTNPKIDDEDTKEILIGRNPDGEGITLTLDLDRGGFSMHGDVFALDDILTEESGEERARDSLEDGELWKMSVEGDNTQQSKEDWIDDVIKFDGWELTVGDIHEIADNKFVQLIGGGQIDVSRKFDKWDKLLIDEKDLKLILKAWKELHLTDFSKMTDMQKKLVIDAVEVYRKMKEFDDFDLEQLVK